MKQDQFSNIAGDAPAVVGEFPCTHTQQRCWFLDQLNPGNPALNVAVRWEIRGRFEIKSIESAFQQIVDRHEILRTRFIVKDGQPLAGISVSANGVNYTGTAGTLTTGLDGRFASDLMKSETANEDVDGNGKRGETFTAQIAASSELGIVVGAAFDSPTVQGSIGGDIATCKPASCDCLDLGDIEVTFEMPRACEVTVHATYSGKSIGAEANLAAGDALEGATLRGELVGDISMPVSATADACGAGSCYSSVASANGTATFVVPVMPSMGWSGSEHSRSKLPGWSGTK